MSKKCYRFFGGLLTAQENWLNKMSSRGDRLVRVGKMLYVFEQCKPNAFQYRVDFIGEKSKAGANEYRSFLEDMGYKVFFKNINLTIRLERFAGGRGPKKADASLPMLPRSIVSC